MDPASAVGSVLAGLGLSSAAGLNAWIPLFALGLLDRLDVVALSKPYSDLSSTPALIVMGALLALDFVGDKVPAVDHVLHAAGTVIHPAAGAIVFAGQAGVGSDIPPVATLLAGATVAGSLHATRAAVRGGSTVTTAGIANPVLSLGEDAVSLAVTAAAFVMPLVAALAAVALLGAFVLAWRRARRRRRQAGPAPPA